VIDTNDLEVKFKLCTSFIVKEVIALDPLARRHWLFTYKGIIQYADSHGSELTQEQRVGANIYRDLIKQVEELIKEEDFEGQNYNAYTSRDPDYETIYKKRLKQIREDFPIPDQFKERTS
jgi:cytolysin (calcineurin-like family phosphatase)